METKAKHDASRDEVGKRLLIPSTVYLREDQKKALRIQAAEEGGRGRLSEIVREALDMYYQQ